MPPCRGPTQDRLRRWSARLQSEGYPGPITVTQYQRFKHIQDQLKHEGFQSRCPRATEAREDYREPSASCDNRAASLRAASTRSLLDSSVLAPAARVTSANLSKASAPLPSRHEHQALL